MFMAMYVAYLVQVYSIPTKLIVNTYQIGLHIVPTGGERTWETRGAKHVDVLGMDDKRQVIVVVPTTANIMPLPFQAITAGTIVQSLLPASVGREKWIQTSFSFANSCNHWSTQENSKYS